MDGCYTKPYRPVSSQTIYFRAGQSGIADRGSSFKNPNGAQMPPPQSTGNKTEQTQRHTQGLFYSGDYGYFSLMALGQGISQVSNAITQGIDNIKMLPTIRKSSIIMVTLFLFSIGFHSGKWWFKEPPEELFTSALASETIQSNNYTKTDKDGFFLEDCY